MKCVVESCKALSRGNGVGKNGEYCLRHEGRRYPRKCTYHGCNHYILRSKLCAKHYLEKELRLHNTWVVDIQQQVNCTLPKRFADLVAAYIFERDQVLFDELKYDGIDRVDGILVFQGKKTTEGK